MKNNYTLTKISCYIDFITQAVIINLPPLLFASFMELYSLSYEELARLVVVNFCVQILTDLTVVRLSGKLSMRIMAVTANTLSAAGLICFGILPLIIPQTYLALIISVVIFSVGAGFIECVGNPIIAAIPGQNSKIAIPLLHSFYCIGHVLVCIVSTVFLHFCGSDVWYILPLIWSLLPIFCILSFSKAPIVEQNESGGTMSVKTAIKSKIYIIAMVMMLCGGAAEQTQAQWVSLFAEKGLGLPKIAGDIIGICGFALLMALCRMGYGIFGEKLNMKKILLASSVLCVFSYLGIFIFHSPILALLCCAVCGISVALMWPGMVALTSEQFPAGGTAVLGVLSVMGDIGCSLGPWIAGAVCDKINISGSYPSHLDGMQIEEAALRCGIFTSVIFPIVMVLGMVLFIKYSKHGGNGKTEQKPVK